MAVTSQVKPTPGFGEVVLKDWEAAGLLKPSVIKPVITTIDKELVIKRLGRLLERERSALENCLKVILD